MEDDRQIKKMRVLMFPWLAHGHITPFLELAKKLTLRNFHIYLCSSPVNLNAIKPKLVSDPKLSNSIELVELHLPSLPSLPPHYHTTKGLPPHLMPTFEKAIDMAKPSFSKILDTLKPDLVIRDFAPAWVPDLASNNSLQIPTIVFITSGAALISFSLHCLKNKGHDGDDDAFPFPEVSLENMKSQLVQNSEKTTTKVFQSSERSSNDNTILMKSFRELEGKYMDYISSSFGMKVVPVGPLVPYQVHDDDEEEGMNIINWLNKKEKSSTVFVCFGSQCYLSKEDMEEMAYGLELSNVDFIWVVRFAKGEKMKLEDALPNGFLERVRDKALIVEDWAPQIKILKHSSIGGFVSHCGWSSLLESMKFGVPIIAMPMQFDQPLNARLVEECGVGLEVERDNNGRVGREKLAKVIRKVVVEKNGDGIRKKAKEMSENIEKKDEKELDELVKELLQLCQK